MPALITHDTFGQNVYNQLYSDIGGTRDEAEAFLLGNQGPDPLFYSVLNPRLRAFNRLGNVMHNQKPDELLVAFRNSLGILRKEELPVGRAYALGFLCHYLLDSNLHPLVFFHEYRLCDAGEPGLSRADGSEVHAIIESEFDEMILFEKRGETVATFDPSRAILKGDRDVLDIVSKMYVYAALTVYGIIIPPEMFTMSVKDFRRTQHLFHSATGRKRDVLGRVEELVRPHSLCRSMSHRPIELTESEFDNRDHARWANPFTGETHTESFWDIYETTAGHVERTFEAFLSDGFGVQAAGSITGHLDFSGKPTVATLVRVESDDTTEGDGRRCGTDDSRNDGERPSDING